MKGLILYIISFLLKRIFLTVAICYNSIFLLLTFRFKDFDEYFFNLAIGNDQIGNVAGKYLFNHVLIKEDINQFGNPDETISSVIGKNKKKKNLTFLGKKLDFILNLFESNHSIKSIEHDE